MCCDYKICTYKEDFDFFEGEFTGDDELFFAFGDQLQRARQLLKHRTRSEINYIIESLDWMLRESSQVEFHNTIKRLEYEESVFNNRVKAFKLFSNDYDITDQKSIPNASWSDYFATLSLVTVLEAIHPASREYSLTRLDYPMEALEAVCIAESYKELEDLKTLSAKKRGKAGGKRKASKYDEILNMVLIAYRDTPELSDLSNRKAGYMLSEMLKNEIEASPLNSDEPEHRIEIWLGKYKKGKLQITE